ncbi:transcriptional regulator, AraC family [Formosa agariphila KMM 3901]|uniref:Transcriptional regulator, AraC family n=1 Tax=Formosa agariphila (strain DSM 15362 / KCTC 12365 / LMG 23005 / KMM 3901 / M-2Alg 35-1) TaxID=1347342 RepID=T2KRV3_FORAG|nr:helix-turn-helix transcriptional regulator [Formosa agariphila]CDF80769.1 transcriptional regulator, AraC family [Formosa agariphila KMM 3901]
MQEQFGIRVNSKIELKQTLKIEPFDTTKRFTKPHKHNKYFEIVYLSQGSGLHTIDTTAYVIDVPQFFFVKREEVHHWSIDTEPKGFVVIFKDEFIENTKDKEINLLVLELSKINMLNVKNKEDQMVIETIFELLCKETKTNSNINIIEGLLKALLSKITSLNTYDKKGVFGDVSEQFLYFLSESPQNNVSYYANKLCITPQYLNTICKQAFNKSASEVIATYINKEAKRLLLYTAYNVSEIAHLLHFKDASHFGKYFKKNNQITPLNYRKSAVSKPV